MTIDRLAAELGIDTTEELELAIARIEAEIAEADRLEDEEAEASGKGARIREIALELGDADEDDLVDACVAACVWTDQELREQAERERKRELLEELKEALEERRRTIPS